MKPLKLTTSLIIIVLVISGIASQALADISNAALLYLRIAPGARAAGMGEAYVAVADDATSTHWNPAGLGASPLADTWETTNVPFELQPITAIKSVKARGGNDYLSFDIWAISEKGLVRYDNKKWYLYEVFNTKTDQTVRSIASSYFALSDDDKLDRIVEKIARNNNARDFDWLQNFSEQVMAVVPEDYDRTDELKNGFDSLLAAYNNCLINWGRLLQAEKNFNNDMKDSVLSTNEVEKINFGIEKSKNRFIPEELKIYYSTLFESMPANLAASENILLVGSDKGLYVYNGRSWKALTTEDGLPSNNILTITGIASGLFIGTDKGIVKYTGQSIASVGSEGSLPEGAVTVIGATSSVDVWIVLDNRLYYYDGLEWSDSRIYTITLDDTPEKIARKFALYNTDKEKAEFIRLMKELNKPEEPAIDEVVEAIDTTTPEIVTDISDTTSTTINNTTFYSEVEIISDDQELEPGKKIKIPFVAGFKGTVNVIFVGLNRYLWLGTDYGVVYFDGTNWQMPGYIDYTVLENQTFDSLLTINNQAVYDPDTYRSIIKDINDMDNETIEAGQVVKLYRYPTASPVKYISSRSDHVYLSSANGMFEYYDGEWSRVNLSGFDRYEIVKIHSYDNKLWFASDKKIVTKADGRTDISMMVAKWLPQLADDMYYGFLSVVSSREGLGTFGGSITFISYGTINRTDANGVDLGTFDSFDITFAGTYGTSLTRKLKIGLSAKFIYSYLTEQGTELEKGKGTATGFGLDFGFLYHMNNRLNLGLAITNLGPDISYIDAAQSDPLPRNMALGFAYKLINSDYYHFLVTAEVNKSLVGVDDGFSEELKQLVLNGGAEFMYANIFAARAGYIYDEEGDIKTITLGFGLAPLTNFKFDFAYIPSGTEAPLANTLRISLQILP